METTHLTAYIGDSASFEIPLTWEGAAFDPESEWALISTFKYRASDLDAAAIFQKTSGAGITVTGTTATLTTVHEDTASLPACNIVGDIQAENVSTGEIRTVAYIRLALSQDITRETTTSIPVITTEDPLPFGPNAWDQIADKPSEFTPSAHTHPLSEISQSSATSGQVPAWNGSAWAATTPTGGDPQAGKPSRLFNTLKRLSASRTASKPIVLSTLSVGDSWALSVDDYIKGLIGTSGYLVGPGDITAVATSATITAPKTEYAKTPWGQSGVVDTSGGYVTWGLISGGSPAAGRFCAARFLTVHYEAVNGGGSFKVQYESRTGAWTDVATINTNNSGASTYAVWESSALASVETPRIRTVWVSGISKIYAAGAAANSANDPATATGRTGGIFCDVSVGGSNAVQWDATPQAVWTALLGWLKTDIVFVRERRDNEIGAWETAITSLVSKVRTARAGTDFVFIGAHPTTEITGAGSDRDTDALLKTYTETNGHLFIDLRSFFPTTYDLSNTIGFQDVDGIHQSNDGKIFARSVVWKHLSPVRDFVFEAEPRKQNGPWFSTDGVQKQFFIQQDGNVEDAYFGTTWTHRGTTSPGSGFTARFMKRDTSSISEGLQFTYQSQPFWQMNSQCRHYISGASNNTLSRSLGAVMEVNTGLETISALRVSGITGQTEWIFPCHVGAAYNASGTRVSGFDHNGNLSLRAYTTTTRDAIASPTAGLVIMNTTTGKLNFYTGSAWEAITSA